MGWDAFAARKDGKDLARKFYCTKTERMKLRLVNGKLRSQFENIAKKIQELSDGQVDAAFPHGTLDCSDCAVMLEKATGFHCYPEESLLPAEKVKELFKKADWSFSFERKNAWAYWSARYFLTLCAKNSLSIRFSY